MRRRRRHPGGHRVSQVDTRVDIEHHQFFGRGIDGGDAQHPVRPGVLRQSLGDHVVPDRFGVVDRTRVRRGQLRSAGNALVHYWRGVFMLLQPSAPEAVGVQCIPTASFDRAVKRPTRAGTMDTRSPIGRTHSTSA